MTEFMYELKIPKDRVAVLIGKGGAVKKIIEEETGTKIRVDSQEGDIFVTGDDGVKLYSAKELITAIGRGFNPEIAQLLLHSDYMFEILNITEFCKTKNDMIRVKGRVIGSDGKCRRIIEEMTECHISVYGKTISLIGKTENVSIARRATESLLRGSPHRNVYKFLENQRRELKQQNFLTKEDLK